MEWERGYKSATRAEFRRSFGAVLRPFREQYYSVLNQSRQTVGIGATRIPANGAGIGVANVIDVFVSFVEAVVHISILRRSDCLEFVARRQELQAFERSLL